MPKTKPSPNPLTKTLQDAYLAYENTYGMDFALYKKILKAFNQLLMKSMVDEGKVYILPQRVGYLGVFKKPIYGHGMFDFQQYKETGDKVWKKNPHSSMQVARILWMEKRPYCNLPWQLKRLYDFIPSRSSNRYLAHRILHHNSINLYYDE